MRNKLAIWASLVLVVFVTRNGIACTDSPGALSIEFDVNGDYQQDPEDQNHYYVKRPKPGESVVITATGNGDTPCPTDSDKCFCIADNYATSTSPTEKGDPTYDFDYPDDATQDDDVVTWTIDSSTAAGDYQFQLQSLTQDYSCPDGYTSGQSKSNTQASDTIIVTVVAPEYHYEVIADDPNPKIVPVNDQSGDTFHITLYKYYMIMGENTPPEPVDNLDTQVYNISAYSGGKVSDVKVSVEGADVQIDNDGTATAIINGAMQSINYDMQVVVLFSGPSASLNDKHIRVEGQVTLLPPAQDDAPPDVNGEGALTVFRLDSVELVSGATANHVIPTHTWATVKSTNASLEYVVLEARTTPVIDPSAIPEGKINWSGAEPAEGNQLQCEVAKNVSLHSEVVASCGNSSATGNVWIIWASVENQTTGSTPAGAAPYGTRYDGTEILGVRYFNNSNSAVGKVVPIGTLTPAGIQAAFF